MTFPRYLAALPFLALAACVPKPAATAAPAPTPRPTPIATPAPTPAPVPAFVGSWMDAPITSGDWSYQAGMASFGEAGYQPYLSLRCDRAADAIVITRAGNAAGELVLRTETMERGLATQASGSEPPSVVTRVQVGDPLLDAIAFSKGRFAVETVGQPTLYVPSYPEITRVIEDCR